MIGSHTGTQITPSPPPHSQVAADPPILTQPLPPPHLSSSRFPGGCWLRHWRRLVRSNRSPGSDLRCVGGAADGCGQRLGEPPKTPRYLHLHCPHTYSIQNGYTSGIRGERQMYGGWGCWVQPPPPTHTHPPTLAPLTPTPSATRALVPPPPSPPSASIPALPGPTAVRKPCQKEQPSPIPTPSLPHHCPASSTLTRQPLPAPASSPHTHTFSPRPRSLFSGGRLDGQESR